jgi:hypothetical protein
MDNGAGLQNIHFIIKFGYDLYVQNIAYFVAIFKNLNRFTILYKARYSNVETAKHSASLVVPKGLFRNLMILT